MYEVVYLLGAGASYGARNESTTSYCEQEKSHIVRGLPLMSEIPLEMNTVIKKLESFITDKDLDVVVKNNRTYRDVLEDLIKSFKQINEECKDSYTIDTLAKRAMILENGNGGYENLGKYNEIKMLVSIFFLIEQVLYPIDLRYDIFLADTLREVSTSKFKINRRIRILSWNYDSQIELAYKRFTGMDFTLARKFLSISDLNEYQVNYDQIVKLNGTANFKDPIDFTEYDRLDSEFLKSILKAYNEFESARTINNSTSQPCISYAWENNGENTLGYMEETKTVVVIGYSFPFCNRVTDRMVFSGMKNLEKIYIQDQNPTPIIDTIKPALVDNPRHDKIELIPIRDVNKFFMPPEL